MIVNQYFSKRYISTPVTARHISSDTVGAHHMPAPPIRAIHAPRADTMVTTPRPREIIRDSPGFSMAVKKPPATTLNPMNRKDMLKMRNTNAE